ncbi:MAG: hypothetical protein SOW80_03080 [Anaerovoracaceae bacterium]|nr:hypothetical protein [Anaerovoracaceae bacterium]
MNITYHDISIRNAEKKDCNQLAIWWNDGKVMEHAGFPNGLGTSAAEIEKQIANDDDKAKRRLIVEYKGTLIEELFNRGANLIFLDTNLKNTRAQHVYEMLGFRKVSVNIDSWKNQLGELQSSVNYELEVNDFCNLKGKR